MVRIKNNFNNKNGFIAIFITILVLGITLGIALSISFLVLKQQKISENIVKSNQAYYLAEAGIEDALIRLIKGTFSAGSYSLALGSGVAVIEVSDPLAGSRTIISQGNFLERVRKIKAVRALNSDLVSFNCGAQAGDGGIEMENNSVIHGNVFSNGTVKAVHGKAQVDNTVIVAKSGNKIDGLVIGSLGNDPPDEARAHTCVDSTINGNLYYVSGGSSNCTINGGSENVLPNNIDPIDLPVSEAQITKWKNEAAAGGIEFSDHIVSGSSTEYLGPKKIEAKLILENNAVLILTGNLWIAGNITINNGATVKLDDNYGIDSGIVVSDGKILVENGAILEGSGAEGSYIMFLSTNNSVNMSSPAVYVKNNAQGAIFYASLGMIRLRNNINIREATGWKIYLDNNAEITYESGLASLLFSSGPGGGWKIIEWREIE